MIQDVDTFSCDTGSTKSKKSKPREDVVVKSVLRAIKKYFLKQFQEHNRKLVRKRIRNIPTRDLLAGLKKMLVAIMGDLPTVDDLAYFLLIILGLKRSKQKVHDQKIEENGLLFIACTKNNYSSAKYNELVKVREVGQLVNHIFTRDLDSFFDGQKGCPFNSEIHRSVFLTMKEKCNQQSQI